MRSKMLLFTILTTTLLTILTLRFLPIALDLTIQEITSVIKILVLIDLRSQFAITLQLILICLIILPLPFSTKFILFPLAIPELIMLLLLPIPLGQEAIRNIALTIALSILLLIINIKYYMPTVIEESSLPFLIKKILSIGYIIILSCIVLSLSIRMPPYFYRGMTFPHNLTIHQNDLVIFVENITGTKKDYNKMVNEIIDPEKRKLQVTEDILINFIEGYFYKRGGNVRVVSLNDYHIRFFVTNLRGEIIKTENFWENVEASIFFNEQGTSIVMSCILDGQFAAGFFSPKDQNFSDMEPEYKEHLENYAGELVAKFRHHLLLQDNQHANTSS